MGALFQDVIDQYKKIGDQARQYGLLPQTGNSGKGKNKRISSYTGPYIPGKHGNITVPGGHPGLKIAKDAYMVGEAPPGTYGLVTVGSGNGGNGNAGSYGSGAIGNGEDDMWMDPKMLLPLGLGLALLLFYMKKKK